MPRSKSSGFYLQFRLPHNTGQVASNRDTRSEDANFDVPSSKRAASGVVLELAVCGSNTAKRAVGRRRFTITCIIRQWKRLLNDSSNSSYVRGP
ncbi:hypothetical protein GN958_ATG11222 [Phytophthora infestans]|uniref:Uncharacterized protein n=1 Tax=Phytophthora infestans TaxID=4787 RepID=A0A8S9UJS9_PHYIN|nr:hypothetical protein GN958_ATG11222 [Phytophthora infestans]